MCSVPSAQRARVVVEFDAKAAAPSIGKPAFLLLLVSRFSPAVFSGKQDEDIPVLL